MEDKPVQALRSKRDNSISKSWGLMASGDVKAVVSAGNTGAMVASAMLNNKMFLPGVRRPGIAAIFPSHQGPVVIVDVGANMNAKPEDLYQYGVMGAIYAEAILGLTDPKIGLLNVGAEDDKGTDLTKATRALFQNGPHATRFVGNVEGRDIYEGHARVVVCEGFVGNVLLKSGEGAVEFLFNAFKQELGKLLPELGPEASHKLAGSFKELKTRFEYQEFGGGPLLGLRGACIICHGSSGARAIRNALRVAGTMAEDKLNEQIVSQLERGPRPARGQDLGGMSLAIVFPTKTRADAQDRLPLPRPGSPGRRHGSRALRRYPGRPGSVQPGRRDPRVRPQGRLLRRPGRGPGGDRRQPTGHLRCQPRRAGGAEDRPSRGRGRLRGGGGVEPGRVHRAGVCRLVRLRDRPQDRPTSGRGHASRGRRDSQRDDQRDRARRIED